MVLLESLRSGAARVVRACAGAALGVGLAAGVAAPGLARAQDLQVAQTAAPAPALWVIRDADSAIYLFGTVHLMRPGDDWMQGQVRTAFESADQLWLELDDPANQAAMIPLIQQYGVLRERPLSSLLTAEEFALLDEAARGLGLSGAMIDPMRPWLAALQLSVAPLVRAGYDPTAGIDMILRARAVEAGLPVHGLETMEQQIRFFAELPEADQLVLLRETLTSYAQAAEVMDQLSGAWAAGDPDALYALGGAEMKAAYPDFYDVLLTHRNARWAERITQELAGSGTVFVAVGALHLAGPDSVQAQLASRGVTVVRVD